MNGRTSLKGALALTAGVALAIGLAGPASAHITADPGTAAAGSFAFVQFNVGHGCDGSPTTELAMQIPDGVISVKPEVTPGWEISTTEGPITPYDSEGETVSTGVTEVSWTGGDLPDDRLQRFGISMKFPDRPGETLYFPVVQTCAEGETAWIEIPEEGAEEPEHPAPSVELTAAAEGGHGDDAAATTVEAVDDGGEQAAGASAGSDDKDGTGIAIVALVVGALGLVAGGVGLGMTIRRKPQQ